ncbi:protein-tyrosine phosphatase family protein [Pseudonocardia hydrocarbonoxydans]|uniref:Tyrosine specific protein phosphatases domain-containing protein n=1 Tax=Pseudonocardia hydrocarbonoxydans TaxID=76726 RepID=A0A4Y3WII8_9PSEU|nr:protein-tyrosine phosphatase family protein [Pseudonocardia hydrocarbonoxydans]GEC18051.1 hypothetical protein PHY01_03340 [Pseudonocardia hydrocarbonoxydans]
MLPQQGHVVLPDGTVVRGRGRRDAPADPPPEFGLYLHRRRGGWEPGWPAQWLDWPDFRTPRDRDAAAAAIEHAHRLARDGSRVEIACDGGTGRTGTVIACMAVLAGHPAEDAVAWTRAHYRPRAVETPWQRRWVLWFAARRPDDDGAGRVSRPAPSSDGPTGTGRCSTPCRWPGCWPRSCR